MDTRTVPPPQASARQTELGDAFNRALFAALDAIEEKNIPYALIGGIAASGLGRPRPTHDIDVFVRPEDAEVTLEALGRHGFDTERTDPLWLFKGWKDGMMVDIIFKSQGDIYFDDEMHARAMPIQFHGRDIHVVSPEDLIIIKCAVHTEVGPHHWHDALAVLSHATLDWNYLLKRSRRAARRLLALLVYAQSNDIWIPNWVVVELFQTIFGDSLRQAAPQAPGSQAVAPRAPERPFAEASVQIPKVSPASKPIPEYIVGHIQDALSSDSRTAVADVQVSIGGRRILIKGEVRCAEQKKAIENLVRENAPDYDLDSQLRITDMTLTDRVEEVV
jgi:predicted nucleotidyltransferase